MEQFLATMIRASVPIILVAMGGVFAYRAGIFHLGLEGLMIIGAFAGVAGTVWSGSWIGGLALAMASASVASAVFWFVIVKLKANAIIAGLGLTGLGLGGSAFALNTLFNQRGALLLDQGLPRPVNGVNEGLGVILSEQSIVVWVTPIIVIACWVILKRTRFGLRLSAVGEYPFAARSVGVSPDRMRFIALVAGGALCGLGGAELSLGSLSVFQEAMTQGRGFIAFTAVLLGGGDPIGAAVAGLFFGFTEALGIQSQLSGSGPIPREFVLMLPYVVTIIAVLISGIWQRRSLDAAAGFAELRD